MIYTVERKVLLKNTRQSTENTTGKFESPLDSAVVVGNEERG